MQNNLSEIGKEYCFFDNCVISSVRCSQAKVTRVITKEEAKNIYLYYCKYDCQVSLYDIWQDSKKEEKDCYSNDTDFFIACSIPTIEDNEMWFVRDGDNFVSLEIYDAFEYGVLDVSGKLEKQMIENDK